LPAPGALRVPVALPPQVEIPYGITPRLAISPDGRRIAYVGNDERGSSIYVQDLHVSGSAVAIDGTGEARTPFFSPDGESLGYLRGGDVEILPLGGGKPRTLVEGLSLSGGAATWASDGSVYYVDFTSGIEKVAVSAGSPQLVKTLEPAKSYGSPQLLPGGRHLLHVVWYMDRASYSVAVTALDTGEQTILFEGGFAPRYVPTGHLLVAQEDLLLGMTFDVDTLEVGPPVPILRGLTTDFGEGVADYAVSDSGSLVFLTGALEREGWLVRLAPGREPERLNRQPTNFNYLTIDLSPDGRRVAVDKNDFDIWIFDLESRDFEVRVTTEPEQDWVPEWDWTGKTLAFVSNRGGGQSIYSRRADGLGVERLMVEDRVAQIWSTSWSPDGQVLLFARFDRETKLDLWVVETDEPASARPFLQTPFSELHPMFSPDGRWLAYLSDESGRLDIYVTSYPDRDIKRKVSRDGGEFARWSADSDRLFYSSGQRVMVVEALDATWTPSQAEVFVEGVDKDFTWDVAPDGQSVIALERRAAPRLHLVQNWFQELERLVPTR
jgi:serine/threonine-protein kinase